MRLHRVHYWTETDASEGFTWHASRRDAERAARTFCREHARRYELDGSPYDPGARGDVESFEFATTRAGILALLACVAEHPDNG